MARVSSSEGRTFTLPPQRVVISGRTYRSALCVAIDQIEGLRANQAQISLPRAVVRDSLEAFEQATVDVFVGTGDAPAFHGWISTSLRQEDEATNRVALTARSVLARLDGCRIEQESLRGELLYPRKTAEGADAGWTLASILADLFMADRLPADWRALVGLGDLRGIRDSAADPELPDLALTGSYLQALSQILAYVPDVGVRERYLPGGKTLLDFYVIGRGSGPLHVLRGATSTEGPPEGALLVGFQRTTDTAGVFNRCIGYGRPNEHEVTCWTGHATAPLEPAWDNPASNLTDPLTYSADETAVLADPDLATPTSGRYDSSRGAIFRVWRLPAVLRENARLKSLIRTDAAGTPLQVQVFRQKYVFPSFSSFPWTATGVSGTEYELIKGASLNADGYLTLPSPCCGLERMTASGAKSYLFVHLFVTLAIAETRLRRRPVHDTGRRGRVGFEGLEDDGLVLDFINQGIGLAQTAPEALPDSAGGTHDFGVIVYNPDTEAWDVTAAGAGAVLEDDRRLLAILAERAIAERNQPRTDIAATEALLRRILPGDRFVVRNRASDGIVCTCYAVRHDLTSGMTTITGSDQRPPAIRPATRVTEGALGRGMARRGGSSMELADMIDAIRSGNSNPAGTALAPAPAPSPNVTRFDEFGVGYQRENPAVRDAARREGRRGQRYGQGV